MMRTLIIFLIVCFGWNVGHGQDIIYNKNGSSIFCKVNEVAIDLVRYKRVDIKDSPVFEVKKDDIWKIKYKNGVTDIFNQHDSICKRKGTANYSTLYVVFNSGQSDQYFPFYFGEKYICTLKNHSRLALKIKDEGDFNICRNNKKQIGPLIKLSVCNGNDYGIMVTVPYPQGLDPNKRFALTVFGPDEVQPFIEDEYKGFEPFKSLDFHIELK